MARPYSALTRLLPYLEQQPLYASINFAVETYPVDNGSAFQSPQNRTAYETNLAVYLCPSDATSTPTTHGCNYRGNYGLGAHVATNRQTYDSGNGFYTFPGVLGSHSFPDGLSHTVAYSERLRGTGDSGGLTPSRDFGDIQVMTYCTERDADIALACCRLASTRGFRRLVWPDSLGFMGIMGVRLTTTRRSRMGVSLTPSVSVRVPVSSPREAFIPAV
ncbi:MAG: DUF1559 domain-containing protein [Singulisphaera sp.]